MNWDYILTGWAVALALLLAWLAVRWLVLQRRRARASRAFRARQLRHWGRDERCRFEILRAEGWSIKEIAQAEEDAR